MQSWGTTSRFDERDTQLEPSKSGVIGLICAALGRDRSEPVSDLAGLRMAVRADREGVLMRDYQTASGVLIASGKPNLGRTVVSPRFYLSDAVFLVGLEGEDRSLLERVHAALKNPVWPLFLGRKSFPPGESPYLPNGLSDRPLETAIQGYPRLAPPQRRQGATECRLMLEHSREGAVRLDQPIAPFAKRQFGPRFVKSGVLHVSDETDA